MRALLQLLYKALRSAGALFIRGLLIITTPLVEKNPAKALAVNTPVVLSMARVVVLGFAVALLRQIWRAGIAGWPDATLSISVVLALPVVGALERVRPSEVISLARAMVGRFGHGGVRTLGSTYTTPSTAPSKFDDHRCDVRSVGHDNEQPTMASDRGSGGDPSAMSGGDDAEDADDDSTPSARGHTEVAV
jgi:hypothetical protein